jgi:hypothetical protein
MKLTSPIRSTGSISGSKAAALVAVGVGLVSILHTDTISTVLQPLLNQFGDGSTDIKPTWVGAASGLGSWVLLYQRWRRKKKRIRRLLIIGIILLVLGLTGVLPIF